MSQKRMFVSGLAVGFINPCLLQSSIGHGPERQRRQFGFGRREHWIEQHGRESGLPVNPGARPLLRRSTKFQHGTA